MIAGMRIIMSKIRAGMIEHAATTNFVNSPGVRRLLPRIMARVPRRAIVSARCMTPRRTNHLRHEGLRL